MSNSADDTFFGNPTPSSFFSQDDSEVDKIQLLHSVVQEALQQLFNIEGVDAHVNEYKHISVIEKNPEYVRRLYSRLAEKVSKKVDACVEKQNEANDLHNDFNKLKELCNRSTSTDSIAWRPSENVDDNIRSIIMAEKIKYRNQLMAMVSEKENKVFELKNKVLHSRSEKERMKARLKVLTNDLDDSNAKIQAVSDVIE